MYRPQLKASQIANLTDARYFAAWGVEWMGFTLEEGNPSFISPMQVEALKAWIEGPKIVGEFTGIDLNLIEKNIQLLQLDAVQVSHFSNVEGYVFEVPLMVHFTLEASTTRQQVEERMKHFSQAFAFVFDFASNSNFSGEWKTLDKLWLKEIASAQPLFIQPGNTEEGFDSFIKEVRPYGINLAGSEEEKVGVKSFDDLDEILESLEPLREIF